MIDEGLHNGALPNHLRPTLRNVGRAPLFSQINADSASLDDYYCFVVNPILFADLSEVIVESRSVFQ